MELNQVNMEDCELLRTGTENMDAVPGSERQFCLTLTFVAPAPFQMRLPCLMNPNVPFGTWSVAFSPLRGGRDLGLEGTMTVKEADRAALIAAVVEKRVKQREAADRLGLSVRQVKRLARRCREQGAAGMASARRGAPSNRAFGAEVRLEAVRLVRERYPDFGPTFAAEKLLEEHGLALSRETRGSG